MPRWEVTFSAVGEARFEVEADDEEAAVLVAAAAARHHALDGSEVKWELEDVSEA